MQQSFDLACAVIHLNRLMARYDTATFSLVKRFYGILVQRQLKSILAEGVTLVPHINATPRYYGVAFN